MKCPDCDSKLLIIDTRDTVRRRRCANGHTHVTHEVLAGLQGDRRGALPTAPLGPMQLRVLNALEGRTMNVHMLMAELDGATRSRVMDAIRGLRHRRMVYIAGYSPKPTSGGRAAPLYAPGDAPDAHEPSVPKAELQRRYRERKRLAKSPWVGLITP